MSNEQIGSLPEDYERDAPLAARLQSWAKDIKTNYGWYEISDAASAILLADIEAALSALQSGPSNVRSEEGK